MGNHLFCRYEALNLISGTTHKQRHEIKKGHDPWNTTSKDANL